MTLLAEYTALEALIVGAGILLNIRRPLNLGAMVSLSALVAVPTTTALSNDLLTDTMAHLIFAASLQLTIFSSLFRQTKNMVAPA